MLDAPAQESLRGTEMADFLGQHVHQLILGVWTAVGQGAFEVVPDAFIRVQFGSICRKWHQVQTARAQE